MGLYTKRPVRRDGCASLDWTPSLRQSVLSRMLPGMPVGDDVVELTSPWEGATPKGDPYVGDLFAMVGAPSKVGPVSGCIVIGKPWTLAPERPVRH